MLTRIRISTTHKKIKLDFDFYVLKKKILIYPHDLIVLIVPLPRVSRFLVIALNAQQLVLIYKSNDVKVENVTSVVYNC